MSSIFRAGPASDQRISRGQWLLGPVGGTVLRNAGNVVVERMIESDNVDIYSAEFSNTPRLARVTVKQNENLKVTCKGFNSLISSLAYMAPQGEYRTQVAVANGTATIPAGAKDGDIYDFVDANGVKLFGVVVSAADAADANVIVDSAGGAFEVIGDRTVADTFPFTAPAVAASDKKAIFRRLQQSEIRCRARFRENNAFGRVQQHDWPVISIRASGGQKLSDEGNDIQTVELDVAVEFDNQAFGKERGTVTEL